MARKKKPSRKYKPKNEFRYNHSPLAKGHPHFVFGETDTKYKSIGFTRSPVSGIKHTKAAKNPNPKSNDDSYIQHRVHTARKSYYSEPLSGWTLSPEDRSLIRHLTKKYKKSYNRKPPGYYDNKKKKK